jgi:hypothetical protein
MDFLADASCPNLHKSRDTSQKSLKVCGDSEFMKISALNGCKQNGRGRWTHKTHFLSSLKRESFLRFETLKLIRKHINLVLFTLCFSKPTALFDSPASLLYLTLLNKKKPIKE